MSSQYPCGTERPDWAHIVREVLVRNIHRNMQLVKALIDRGAASIFITAILLMILELPHETAFTSTQGVNGQVMMSAKESRKASLLVQYVEHLKPVDESEVLVVSIKAYDLVLGLPWFKARNTEIDWTKGRLTALRTPNRPKRAKIPEAEHASPPPERCEGNTNIDPAPDVQLLGATAFDHLLASQEVVEAFPIRHGECQGLLGASLEGITEC